MTKTEELIAQNKNTLKSMIKSDMNPEDLKTLTDLDHNLDLCLEEHKKAEGQISSLKDELIRCVKNTSFKMSEDPNKENVEPETKSIDTILGEEIAKLNAKE